MPGFPNLSRDGQPAPEPAPLERVAPRSQVFSRRHWPVFLLPLLLLPAAWLLRSRQPVKPASSSAIRTVRAVRGLLETTRRLAGSITAARFANLAAPILQASDQGRGLTLIYLARSGTPVKEGDMVAQIDAQAVKDHLDDVEAQIVQSEMDIRKRKAQLVAQMEAVRQDVRAAKAALDKARQDFRAAAVKTTITRELLKIAIDEAQGAYEGIEKQLVLTGDRQQSELRLLELDYQQQVRHRDRHRTDLMRCTIKSPMDGMVVMQTVFRSGDQGQIKVGDQLAPGQPFMRVVDLASLQVDATMSQTESEILHIGQPATIRFDAFPSLALNGHVSSIGTLALGGRRLNYYVRSVAVRIALESRDPRVIPDLTASADVVTADPTEGLIVPREAVQEENGKPVVYIKQSDSLMAREVELGASNNTQVAVTSGLQAGDEIALPPHP